MINGCVACGAILPAGAKVCPQCQWPVEGAEDDAVQEAEEAVSIEKLAVSGDNSAEAGKNELQTMPATGTQMSTNGGVNQGQMNIPNPGSPNQMGAPAPMGNPNQAGMTGPMGNPMGVPNQMGMPGQMGNPMGVPNQMGMPGQMGNPMGVPNQMGMPAQPGYPVATPYVAPVRPGYGYPIPTYAAPSVVVPPGCILFRGKVCNEEEVNEMMKAYKVNAVAALVCGLLGFLLVFANFFFVFTSLPGFVLSIVGVSNAGTYNGNPKKKRDGKANAGQVFGILGIVFGVFAMIFSVIAMVAYWGFYTDISAFRWFGIDYSIFNIF